MSVRATLIAMGIVASMLTGARAADARGLRESVGLETGRYDDQMQVVASPVDVTERRTLWFSRLDVGVSYPVSASALPPGLEGETSLGLGVLYAVGEFPLYARQQLTWNRSFSSWGTFLVGVSAGVRYVPARVVESAFETGLALGLRLGNHIEVVYRPLFVLPLGSESTTVWGGTLSRRVSTQLAPLNFGVVARFSLF